MMMAQRSLYMKIQMITFPNQLEGQEDALDAA